MTFNFYFNDSRVGSGSALHSGVSKGLMAKLADGRAQDQQDWEGA